MLSKDNIGMTASERYQLAKLKKLLKKLKVQYNSIDNSVNNVTVDGEDEMTTWEILQKVWQYSKAAYDGLKFLYDNVYPKLKNTSGVTREMGQFGEEILETDLSKTKNFGEAYSAGEIGGGNTGKVFSETFGETLQQMDTIENNLDTVVNELDELMPQFNDMYSKMFTSMGTDALGAALPSLVAAGAGVAGFSATIPTVGAFVGAAGMAAALPLLMAATSSLFQPGHSLQDIENSITVINQNSAQLINFAYTWNRTFFDPSTFAVSTQSISYSNATGLSQLLTIIAEMVGQIEKYAHSNAGQPTITALFADIYTNFGDLRWENLLVSGKVSTLEQNYTLMQQSVTTNTNNITTLQQLTTSIQQSIVNIVLEMENLTNLLTALTNRVTTLEGQVLTVQNDITAIDQRIDTIDQTILNIGQGTDYQPQIDSLQQQITDNDLYARSGIYGLDLRVNLLETGGQVTIDYQNADNVVRAEFAAADNVVRVEFLEADNLVRSQFAAADNVVLATVAYNQWKNEFIFKVIHSYFTENASIIFRLTQTMSTSQQTVFTIGAYTPLQFDNTGTITSFNFSTNDTYSSSVAAVKSDFAVSFANTPADGSSLHVLQIYNYAQKVCQNITSTDPSGTSHTFELVAGLPSDSFTNLKWTARGIYSVTVTNSTGNNYACEVVLAAREIGINDNPDLFPISKTTCKNYVYFSETGHFKSNASNEFNFKFALPTIGVDRRWVMGMYMTLSGSTSAGQVTSWGNWLTVYPKLILT